MTLTSSRSYTQRNKKKKKKGKQTFCMFLYDIEILDKVHLIEDLMNYNKGYLQYTQTTD